MTLRNTSLLAALLALISLHGAAALAQTEAGPFTQEQVTAGRAAFLYNCAPCHGPALKGTGDTVPALTGQQFNDSWAKGTTRELYQFISVSMPYGAAGSLSENIYTDIVAFLLAANGAKPGDTPFSKDIAVKIGTIADGHSVAKVLNPPGSKPRR